MHLNMVMLLTLIIAMLIANKDETSKSGPQWRTWDSIVLAAVNGTPTPGNYWLNFGGPWGSGDSPKGPKHQAWWRYRAPQEYPDLRKGNKPLAQFPVFAPSSATATMTPQDTMLLMRGLDPNLRRTLTVTDMNRFNELIKARSNLPSYYKTITKDNKIHTKNSDTFNLDTGDLPTYIRKMISHIDAPSALANQSISYNIYNDDDNLIGTAELSPGAKDFITSKMGGKYYIGDVRIGDGTNKEPYTFTMTINGVND